MVSVFRFAHAAAVVSVVVLSIASPDAAAQAPGSSPSAEASGRSVAAGIPAFAHLLSGKKVTIWTAEGAEHQGVFSVSETGLVGVGRNAGVSVPFDQVVKVRTVTHRTRYGALVGLAAGVALGALVPSPANCSQTHCQDASFMVLYGGIGAGIGAALGGAVTAASRDLDVLYDARRGATSMTIAPILSPSRKGVALKVTWR